MFLPDTHFRWLSNIKCITLLSCAWLLWYKLCPFDSVAWTVVPPFPEGLGTRLYFKVLPNKDKPLYYIVRVHVQPNTHYSLHSPVRPGLLDGWVPGSLDASGWSEQCCKTTNCIQCCFWQQDYLRLPDTWMMMMYLCRQNTCEIHADFQVCSYNKYLGVIGM